jgi:hypothetical protein
MKYRIHLALAAALLLSPAAHAQVASARTTNRSAMKVPAPCEARIDVNALPGNGPAVHEIIASGSYVVTADIECGSGETAISIAPSAVHVTLDLQGFSLRGAPGGLSLHGIECRPSAVAGRRLVLRGGGGTIAGFGGDALSLTSDRPTEAQFVNFIDSSAGVRVTGGDGSVRVAHCVISDCITGVDVTGRLELDGSAVVECAVGVSYCGTELYVFETTVTDSTGDGIAVTDTCLPPATPADMNVDIERLTSLGNGGDALRVALTGQAELKGKIKISNLGSSGCDGFRIDLGTGTSGEVTIEESTFSANVDHGVHVTGSGGNGRLVVRSSSMNENGLDGLRVTDCECSVGYCEMSANGGSGHHYDKAHPKLQELVCNGNGSDGITVVDGGAVVTNSTLNANGGAGLRVLDLDGLPPGEPVEGVELTAFDNSGGGVVIDEARGGELSEVLSNGNTGPGLHLGPGCASMTVRECTATNNTTTGVLVLGSGNLVLSNRASLNATGNYSFAAGNAYGPIAPVAGVGDLSSISFHAHTNYEF